VYHGFAGVYLCSAGIFLIAGAIEFDGYFHSSVSQGTEDRANDEKYAEKLTAGVSFGKMF
jgi:hypothetical protein